MDEPCRMTAIEHSFLSPTIMSIIYPINKNVR